MIALTYFVHGTTIDNESARATGWNQGKLSSLGREQCAQVAEIVANSQFTTVFSSDLARAIESTSIMFGDHADVRADWRLRECNYGLHNGAPASAFKTSPSDHIDLPFPEGESYRAVERRICSFVGDLKSEFHNGARIAVVAHQAPQLALDVVIKGLSWDAAFADDWRRTKDWRPGWRYSIEAK